MGGDDLVGFVEVINHGSKLIYEPAAILHHFHRRDYVGLRKQIYGYGVSLIVTLISLILRNPLLIVQLLLRVPAGVTYLLNPHSTKNIKKQADYPVELTLYEWRGILYGPFAYLKSLWNGRKYSSPKHIRDYIQGGLTSLQYYFDLFPRLYYQPLPWVGLHNARRAEGTLERWKIIEASLRNYSVQSAVDIGCNVGFFCFSLADKGISSIGIDIDERALRIARAVAKKTGMSHVGFSNQFVTPQSVSLIPHADVMIFLSVWHHWVKRYGMDTAMKMLSEIWNACDQVMYFESGQNEMSPDFGLPNIGPNAEDWIIELLSRACPNSTIYALGQCKAFGVGGNEQTNFAFRTLFAVERISLSTK